MNQVHTHICPLFFGFPSHLCHHRVQSRVPCSVQYELSIYTINTYTPVQVSFLKKETCPGIYSKTAQPPASVCPDTRTQPTLDQHLRLPSPGNQARAGGGPEVTMTLVHSKTGHEPTKFYVSQGEKTEAFFMRPEGCHRARLCGLNNFGQKTEYFPSQFFATKRFHTYNKFQGIRQ